MNREEIQGLYESFILPTYRRFPLVLERGEGSVLFDIEGRRLLDFGGGIAVCVLGHAHPEVVDCISAQAKRLSHISNLFYNENPARLAETLVSLTGEGKVFFANSGSEADEGLFKLARKFGNATARYKIITALNSFHGRTLAAIAATGQDKVKVGFEPTVTGFSHVPFNDLEAMREAIDAETAAIMIEGIQGEGGITAATPEYLLGLRKLCNEHNLLLLMDSVQCGHFRTGCFQSFERILENTPERASFYADGISMAKSLGGGFPIGAFWVRRPYADLLGPGSHGCTYGGNPLATAVASKIIEIIQRDRLAENAREMGEFIKSGLREIQSELPDSISEVRGFGLILGFELGDAVKARFTSAPTPAFGFVEALIEQGLVTIPSGTATVRLLPALNLSRAQAEEGLEKIRSAILT